MELALLCAFPQYLISPFWFLVVVGLLLAFSGWMFKRENDALDKDKTKSINSAAGWAILTSLIQYLLYIVAVWFLVAFIVFVFSH